MDEIRTNEPIISQRDKKPKKKAKTILLLVAVFVFVTAICFLLFGKISWESRQKREPIPVSTEYVYNEGTIDVVLTDEPIGLSMESWSREELADVLPSSFPEGMDVQGFPRFTAEGSFYNMRMEVTVTDSKRRIEVDPKTFDYITCENPTATRRGQVTYILCRERWDTPNEERLALAATATIDYVDWLFLMQGTPEEEAEMKADFEALLDSFGEDPPERESIYEMKPKGEPVFYTKSISREDALEDPEFGVYMPSKVPSELLPVYFVRIKESDRNELSCSWAGESEYYWNNASLDWDIEHYDGYNRAPNNPQFFAEELTLADIQAMYEEETSPANGANARKLISFSVVYEVDNIAIYIKAQDIDPEWLYEQIISLKQE